YRTQWFVVVIKDRGTHRRNALTQALVVQREAADSGSLHFRHDLVDLNQSVGSSRLTEVLQLVFYFRIFKRRKIRQSSGRSMKRQHRPKRNVGSERESGIKTLN